LILKKITKKSDFTMPNSEQKFQIRIQITQDLERVVPLFQGLPLNKS